MDKAKAKVFYGENDIPTPRSITLYRDGLADVDEIVGQLGEHVVVKPASEGSALGVTIVEGRAQIDAALEAAFALDREVLVEQYVAGTELTVAVLGNDEAQALPVIEIVPQNDFYDFESKYAPGGSQHICPARLDEAMTAEVQRIAIAAHKALECRGMSRTDIILDNAGHCWVLETNTIPGMTETSLLPDAGRAAGIEFPQLCTRLVELALED
jgi:D-alanine-D-alanine ligase